MKGTRTWFTTQPTSLYTNIYVYLFSKIFAWTFLLYLKLNRHLMVTGIKKNHIFGYVFWWKTRSVVLVTHDYIQYFTMYIYNRHNT